jgi:tRNA A-37 threonylcarbamoyl transferase component Bud32
MTAPATPPAPDPLIGHRLGHSRIIERIGEGGMGSVYRARHEVLDKDVAVKVLAPAVRRDPTLVQRMLREARLAARIDHPGVVTVLDAGNEGGLPYLVMPYIRGKNLDDILSERKRLKPLEALSAVKKAARAIAAAHKLGIVHRDVKPANLIVTVDGHVKVTDFGLALAIAAGDPRLTKADSVVGTPQFMAPEQVSGDSLDVRTDIYALGATLYNLLAGEAPYAGGTPLSVAIKHADPDARPRPLRELVPDLPAEIVALVERMMAKRPEDRFPDMESVIRAIEALQAVARGDGAGPSVITPRIQTRRRWRLWIAAGAIVLVGGAAAAVVLVTRGASRPDQAKRELDAATQLAAAASTPSQLAEALQRCEAIVKAYPGMKEAELADGLRKELAKRAAAAAEADREADALRALEGAEKAANAVATPAQRKEAARRFGEVAQQHAGTRAAALAESRRKELEAAPAEGRELDAFRALRAVHPYAASAKAPEQYKDVAARYRQVATQFPGTAAAQQAAVDGKRYEALAAAEPVKEIAPADLPAARSALQARCQAFLDHLRREPRMGTPEAQEQIRKLAQFVNPEEARTIPERAIVHMLLGFAVGALRKEGWRLDGYTIDTVTVDAKKSEADVSVRYRLKHDAQGLKEIPQAQHWVWRNKTWYLVPEPKERRPGPPRKP